jgi:hypothetical protein
LASAAGSSLEAHKTIVTTAASTSITPRLLSIDPSLSLFLECSIAYLSELKVSIFFMKAITMAQETILDRRG